MSFTVCPVHDRVRPHHWFHPSSFRGSCHSRRGAAASGQRRPRARFPRRNFIRFIRPPHLLFVLRTRPIESAGFRIGSGGTVEKCARILDGLALGSIGFQRIVAAIPAHATMTSVSAPHRAPSASARRASRRAGAVVRQAWRVVVSSLVVPTPPRGRRGSGQRSSALRHLEESVHPAARFERPFFFDGF